jgi:hypothetical protein
VSQASLLDVTTLPHGNLDTYHDVRRLLGNPIRIHVPGPIVGDYWTPYPRIDFGGMLTLGPLTTGRSTAGLIPWRIPRGLARVKPRNA